MRSLKVFLSCLAILGSLSFTEAQYACPNLTMNLQYGSTDSSTGGQVSALQRYLVSKGYLRSEYVTGSYYGLTSQAVKSYQWDNGISTTGTVGPLTRAALARSCGSAMPTVPTNPGTGGSSYPMVTFTASPTSVEQGMYTVLSWNVTNVSSCTIRNTRTGASEALTSSGSRYYYPTQSTTYRLECPSSIGTISSERTVTVAGTVPVTPTVVMPTVSMDISPSSISLGSSAVVSWSSQNAITCTSLGLGGSIGTYGSRTVSPNVTTTYRIDCMNAQGYSSTVERTVAVTYGSPSITSFTASPASVTTGQSVNLLWSSLSATDCSLRYGGTYVNNLPSSGVRTVNPAVSTTYALTCQNGFGLSTPESFVTVAVNDVSAANPTGTLTQTKSSTTVGEAYSVSWSSQNATSCRYETSLSGGAWVLEGTETSGTRSYATPNAGTYIFRITCYGSGNTTPYVTTISHTVTSSTSPTTPTTTARNFVNGNGQAACNADIVNAFGSQVATCSLGGGCSVQGTVPSTNNPSANPGLWGACVMTQTTTPSTPVVVTVSASPLTIQAGQSTMLSWSALQANSCILYVNGVQQEVLALLGSKTVSPTQTTTYRFVCGTGEQSVTVGVTPAPPQLPQVYMTISPVSVSATSNFTASWTGTNNPASYAVRIDGVVLQQGLNTTWTGTPASLGLGTGTRSFFVQGCNSAGCSDWNGPYFLVVQ